ncbi:hypothetical protein [Henriciella aquimarina]|uniref:hypothetical protein n=1 Tax=Henriciella aquimarina TaxID=545261 RepID=UPI0009FCE979|nr:hypothetical protein [Henriciella aquimarina]
MMMRKAKACLEEARKHRDDDGVKLVRAAVRLTLDQVVEDLKREVGELNARSRSPSTPAKMKRREA